MGLPSAAPVLSDRLYDFAPASCGGRREPRAPRYRVLGLTLAAGIALATAGCATVENDDAPAREISSPASASPQSTASMSLSETPAAMAASDPVSVRIPDIAVDSTLLHLGLRSDGSLEVPPPDPGSPAAWYDKSPTPGEVGPAILLGHVNDTQNQDGVFARLDELELGDVVEVTRKDGSVAKYQVTAAEQYSKGSFPSEEVYGDTKGPEIRLITCDGYDPATGQWGDNLVIYGELV